MEGPLEKDCGVLGGLFQQIINDLKNGTPLWEDLIYKATKLQTCLRATIQAIAAYLDAFQKIADAATNTRGATKEIGTALTRICLRHRAVEAKMKTFTSAIMDCLVAPLQEKLEDWKKSVVNLDKEHAREYKRARAELKKRSTDTLRLQKKIRKGGKSDDLQRAMQDVSDKKTVLEEAEKKAVRAALIEERSRYCLFVTFLKPVVEEEVAMLSEMSHLQEVMDQLEKNTSDPYTLPASSEQVISDLKGSDAMWTFQSPPPGSPSSIGSRKSSMCSISSLNSSSSGSSKSHHSPNHLYWNRSISQHHYHPQLKSSLSTQRLCSVSSQDSGFTSQDTLCIRNSTASYFQQQVSDMLEENINSSTESATSLAAPTATWPNLQDTLQFEKAATAIMNDRPHTISTAYERGHHQRPALSVYTFQTPENSQSQLSSSSPVTVTTAGSESSAGDSTPIVSPQSIYASTQQIYARPPVPERGSSLERPSVPAKISASTHNGNNIVNVHLKNATERTSQPTYVNMNELANMAATKAHENASSHSNNDFGSVDNHVDKVNSECAEKESSASESSLESSSGYGSQSGISVATPTPDHDSAQSTTEDVYNGIVVIRHHNQHGQYAPENPYHNPEFIRQRTNSNASTSSAGYCTIKSGTLSRRGSVQNQKPPPPIRRTSSILNTVVRCSSSSSTVPQTSSASASSSISVNNNINGNNNNTTLENLPPPPAFLLQNSTSAAVASGSSNSYDIYGTTIHRTSSVTSFGTGSLPSTVTSAINTTVTNIPLDSASSSSSSSVSSSCSSVFVMKRSVAHSIAAEIQKRNSINTIEQIKLAKEQQPAPQRKSSFTTSTIYQSSSLSSSSSEITDGSYEEKRSWQDGRKFDLEGSSGISVAETVRTLTEMNHQPASPVSIRRTHSNRSISADRRQENSSLIAALSARIAPSLSPRHSRKHYQDTSKMVLPRASRVRQWIALRTVPDPTTCHDSLMDQIKRGTHLRPTGVINDRSAPPTKTNY